MMKNRKSVTKSAGDKLTWFVRFIKITRGSLIPTQSSVAFISGVCFAVVLGIGAIVFSTSSLAGNLTPPGSPANTMYTLTDLYNLASGTTTTEGSGGLPSTPGTATGTMYTLTQVYSALNTQIGNISSTTLKSGTTAFGVTGTIYPNGTLQTNQTYCYDHVGATTTCAGTGQDGEIQAGQALSYTDNADGTVTDNMTGLTWQQGTTTTYTWTNALAYCNNNTPGLPGSGWRLPNAFELYSLLDFSRVNPVPKIDTTYFPSATSSIFWSATSNPTTVSNAWSIGFNSGSVTASAKTNSNYVRCVK